MFVEVSAFASCYARALSDHDHDLWEALRSGHGDEWLEFKEEETEGNIFSVCYYPTSLTGCRELVVKPDGYAIVPKSMSNGKVLEKDIIGSLLKENAKDLIEGVPYSLPFDFYLREFIEEKALLGHRLW